MDFWAILGTIVTCVSLVIAYLQYSKTQSVRDLFRSSAWHLYSLQINASGILQTGLQKLREHYEEELPSEINSLLSRADAHAQDVSRETIRMIQYAEPVFDSTRFEEWKALGKLPEKHEFLFKLIAIGKKRSWWSQLFRR